ncbi:nuclease-related domain-containing protein [Streptomyces sp. NPDC051907]|uniref:nuclease-related domain-containing protein n=1 Tax=Streptomyces sp. NPDC051907 TaxID=3155284 RepID=UPI0034330E62
MTGLRVTPARGHGGGRLWVSLPDGRAAAWYDRDSGRITLVYERWREDVLEALAPYLTGPAGLAGEFTVGPPPVPTPDEVARLCLHPDDDLAPNRPGEALHAELARQADLAPAPARARRLRPDARRPRHDPLRAELAAQQLLGDALDRLDGAGWRILHAVPLPGAGPIDHLAVGPGGVLAVHTLQARRLRVRIADPLVRVGRESAPLLRLTRRRAERAALALAAAVRPVLAVVGSTRLDAVPSPPGVLLLRHDEAPALARLGGVLKPAEVEALYATARDRRTWLRA